MTTVRLARSGDRVAVMASATARQIKFLGYGTYEGEFVRPGWHGSTEEQDYCCLLQEQGSDDKTTRDVLHRLSLNPRIKLDSGETVWGYEVWWDFEDLYNRWVRASDWKVVPITVAELRGGS